MATGARDRERILEFTLTVRGFYWILRHKKARKTGYVLRANSHMFRGRNTGQGTCSHARGGRARMNIAELGENANSYQKKL